MVISISILIVLLTAGGQVLLKMGTYKSKGTGLINGYIISGYVSFLLTILLSYYLMKVIPLKYFTVIMSVNYVVVMVAAKLFLSETINRDKLVGTILIASGIFVFLLGR